MPLRKCPGCGEIRYSAYGGAWRCDVCGVTVGKEHDITERRDENASIEFHRQQQRVSGMAGNADQKCCGPWRSAEEKKKTAQERPRVKLFKPSLCCYLYYSTAKEGLQ